MLRTKIPETGLRVQMGQMWVRLYILCCCFLLVLFNSPAAFCDSMMRKIGPPDSGLPALNSGKHFENIEKQKPLRIAEDSKIFGRGIGSVNQFNARSVHNSARPMTLDGMQGNFAQRRLLGGNVTRSDTTEGRFSAPRMKKRVYVKQRDQNGLKEKRIQNYNVRKDKQGRRSDEAQSLLKTQISQAQQNPNAGMPENRKKKNSQEVEVESKKNDFRTETNAKRQASTAIYKVEKQEEEGGNKNAAVPVMKEKVDTRDNGEEFETNVLPSKLKGRKKAPRLIHKDENEEEENSSVRIPGIKEKHNAQDREDDSNRNELQTRLPRKQPVSKKIRKGDGEEEDDDNSATTTAETAEEDDAQDRKEESNRSKLQARMRTKQPASKTIRKDEGEEEEENSVTGIPGNEDENNAEDRKEESNRNEAQARMRRKQPVSKSFPRDEKETEEENPDASMPEIKKEKIAQDSKEESGIKEVQTRLKGKKPVLKPTAKAEEKEEENQIAPVPENKQKQSAEDSEKESKSNDSQNEVKEETLALESVPKGEKNVNDDGLELAEEFPSPDQSDFESLNNTKDDDKPRDSQSQGTQELEADQVVLNEAISDKEIKRATVKGRERGIVKQEKTNAKEFTKNEIKDDESQDDQSQETEEMEADQVELIEASSDRNTKRVNGKGRERGILKKEETDAKGFGKNEIKVNESRDDQSQETEEMDADQAELNEAISDRKTKRVNGVGRERGIIKQEETDAKVFKKNEIKDDESKDDQSQETEEMEADQGELNEANSKRETKRVIKRVNGEGEERGILKQEEISAEEFTKIEIKDDESRDDQSQDTEETETDQGELNEAISDRESKRMNGKGQERGILKQEDTSAEESTESDIEVDEVESTTNSKSPEPEEEDAGESVNNDVVDETESKTVPTGKQSKSNFRKPAEGNADKSAKNNVEEDAESETVPTDMQSSSVDVDKSTVNSTESGEESEGEYSDFIHEFADLPSKFQDTAEKVADRLMPEIQKFSNKSKIYFSRANEGITEGFRPLIGHQYAPFVASVISYIFVLLPLILVIVSFDQIRTYFPLQKVILYANIYLAAFFATLMLASFLMGMEPMLFFFRNSLSGYTYLQLLEALGYILYLFLQCLNLIISFSNGSSSAKLVAFLQCGVSIFIGLHYYVTVFHRAMAQKAPHTSWMIHGAYTIAFFVLCMFSKVKHGKKEYVQVQYGSGTNKKN